MTDFARPMKELLDSGIPNAVDPAAGMGLTLNHKGTLPPSVLPQIYSTWPTGTPDPNEEFVYVADATAGVYWHFKYVPAQATYPWVFVGGPPLITGVQTDQATASTTYVDLATVGPTLTVPRAGDYEVSFGAQMYLSATAPNSTVVAPKYGSAAASDNDDIESYASALSATQSPARTQGPTLAAGDVVKLQYRVSGGTGQFRKRWLTIRPVRVS